MQRKAERVRRGNPVNNKVQPAAGALIDLDPHVSQNCECTTSQVLLPRDDTTLKTLCLKFELTMER